MSELPIKLKLSESFFEEEIRCHHKITKEVKQLWAVLLDMLVEFNRVCKKRNIKYSLDSGTLLGAIRHKGFIPWDDDIDVIMLRSEYDKLNAIASSEFTAPYFWQTNYTDPGCFRRHAQLRNSLTSCFLLCEMEDGVPKCDFNQGAFLDIFILDAVPDEKKERKAFQREYRKKLELLGEMIEFSNIYKSSVADNAANEAFKLFEKGITKYNNTDNLKVGNIFFIPNEKERILFPKHYYQNLTEYDFEGMKFPAPVEAERVLDGMFGDWKVPMKSPTTHGGLVYDMLKPYSTFISETRQETKPMHSLQLMESFVVDRRKLRKAQKHPFLFLIETMFRKLLGLKYKRWFTNC